jgi:hypothetical protein
MRTGCGLYVHIELTPVSRKDGSFVGAGEVDSAYVSGHGVIELVLGRNRSCNGRSGRGGARRRDLEVVKTSSTYNNRAARANYRGVGRVVNAHRLGAGRL